MGRESEWGKREVNLEITSLEAALRELACERRRYEAAVTAIRNLAARVAGNVPSPARLVPDPVADACERIEGAVNLLWTQLEVARRSALVEVAALLRPDPVRALVEFDLDRDRALALERITDLLHHAGLVP